MGQKLHTKPTGVGISNGTFIVPQINPSTGQVYKMTNEEYHAMMTSFSILSGTTWDGSNRSKTLSSNTALTLTTSRNTGILEVIQDATGSRTLSINGTAIAINSGANSVTLIGFIKGASGVLRVVVELNPISLSGGGDTTAPTVTSRETTSPTNIQITFSEVVTATNVGHSFTRDGVALVPSAVSGSGTNQLNFTVPTILAGEVLLHSYNAGTGNTVDGSSNELVAFSNQPVTNNVGETTPPSLVSATIETAQPNRVVVTFNEAMNVASVPAVGQFVVSVNGVDRTTTSISYFSPTVLYINFNGAAVTSGQTVVFDYAVPGSLPLEDAAGNNLAALTNQAVTNNVAGTDSDAQAYILAEETAASIDIDATNESAINALIAGWKADGLWTDTLQMALGYGTGLKNAKSPGTKDLTSATPPTVNANGYLFDGSNDFLNTNINEAVDLPTKENVTIIFYIKSVVSGSPFSASDGTNATYFNTVTGDFRLQGAGDLNFGASAGTGLFVATFRNDGTSYTRRITKNNVQVYNNVAPVDTDHRVGGGIPYTIGAYNNVGTLSAFFNGTIGGVIIIKRGLSNAEMTSAYNRFNTFISAASRT